MNEELKLQKATAVKDSLQSTIQALMPAMKKSFPRKRILKRAYGRYRLARIEKKAARMQALLIPVMGAIQLARIIQQPIPRFKPGAVLGERGAEYVDPQNLKAKYEK
jgi:hypothetical protein